MKVVPVQNDESSGDAVVLWLVRNMETHTDFNSFLMSKFLMFGQPDLIRLLGDGGAAQTFGRISALHYWQQCKHLSEFAETTRRFLASGNFNDTRTIFAVQGMAQALYYIQYFEQSPLSEQYVRCYKVLQTDLMPRLHEFIDCSAKIPGVNVALAVVNAVTLFMRSIGLLEAHHLQEMLALFRQLYIEDDAGELDLCDKTGVLAHILLNIRGQCDFIHVAWIFDWLDMVQPELQSTFEDTCNPRRGIVLDLIAEILTGYRYFSCRTSSRERYEVFVAGEIHRKYVDVDYVYRFYADADFASDHEALSLYHMMMSGDSSCRLELVRTVVAIT